MKRTSLMVLVAALLLSPLQALGEPPDLLISVSGSDEAIARANNDYFLRKNTYFARRYRIVAVDVDVLKAADRFRITLFDNEYAVAEVTARSIRRDGMSISWRGRIVEPAISVEDVIAGSEGLTPEEANIAHSAIVGLRINAAEIAFDEATGTKYQYWFPGFERFRRSSAAGGGPSAAENPALYTVGMTIAGPLAESYQLRALESDPIYHVLIEIDPDKVFSPGPLEDNEHPERAAKRRAYQDFLRTLGPDPRPRDLHLEPFLNRRRSGGLVEELAAETKHCVDQHIEVLAP